MKWKGIIISMIILLTLLTSCLPNLQQRTFAIRGVFFLSEQTTAKQSFYKEHCDIQIDNRRILLSSVDYNLDIKMDYFYAWRRGIGYDKKGKEWDVCVYDPAKTPYLLTLESDSVNLTVGFKYIN